MQLLRSDPNAERIPAALRPEGLLLSRPHPRAEPDTGSAPPTTCHTHTHTHTLALSHPQPPVCFQVCVPPPTPPLSISRASGARPLLSPLVRLTHKYTCSCFTCCAAAADGHSAASITGLCLCLCPRRSPTQNVHLPSSKGLFSTFTEMQHTPFFLLQSTPRQQTRAQGNNTEQTGNLSSALQTAEE